MCSIPLDKDLTVIVDEREKQLSLALFEVSGCKCSVSGGI